MNSNDMEILSPAGDLDTFKRAIDNGADAVYLGGKNFGARKNATNFSSEQIKEAINYAHLSGSKVYITVNTLVFDEEIEDLFLFLKDIYNSGVDAIIIQDMAVSEIAKKYFPDLKLHASTQMTIHSLDGANILYEEGFERIVLSRELSFGEIENICKNTYAEIEMFVHGALCVCYSGQCLMSSVIGQRSGNRGECAQPCRLPFRFRDYDGNISKNPSYLFSLRDLCLANKYELLKKAGVKSLKIEGRMKNSQYVSFVTDMYSGLKEGKGISKEQYLDAEKIFSRSGFTEGYFDDNKGTHMVNISSNNDDVYKNIPKELFDRCSKMGEKRRRPVYAHLRAKVGEPLMLRMWLDDENVSEITLDDKVSIALNAPLTYEKIHSAISKLGDTFFYLESLEADFDDNAFVPVKDFNYARRYCTEILENNITKLKRNESQGEFSYKTSKNQPKTFEIRAKVNTREQFNECIKVNEIKKIFLEYEEFISDREYYLLHKDRLVVSLPVIIRDKFADKIDLSGVDCVSISNIGHLKLCEGKTLYGDEGLNITNSLSCNYYGKFNFKSVVLSPEMNLRQIGFLNSFVDTEIIAYGRLSLMTSENCLIKTHYGKCNCKDRKFFSVFDRKGKEFPVMSRKFNCINTVYNSAPVYMGDRLNEIEKTGVSAIRLVFTTEDKNTVKEIISMYSKGQKANFEYTRGHLYRGVLEYEKN